MKASSLMFLMGAALFALSGCSTPCESVCADFNDCEISERDHDVDCPTYCDREQQFEDTASKAGADTCKTQFDAYISCWESNVANICDAENTQCDATLTAWTDCVATFCAIEANANDQACVPQDEGPALPALGGF